MNTGKRFTHQFRSRVFALALASLFAGGASSMFAAPANAQSESSADVIDEIIVTTARRREESLQEVPLSMSLISGDALEKVGAPDIIEIAKMSPNLTLEVSRGTNSTLTAFIRGVGQQDPVAGFESGVGLYVDDVYFNRPHAAVLDLYDVDRIEVLRGPQGTLYGRNTIGGAIRYVTRKLSDEPELRFRLGAGEYNQLDGLVSGSTPLSDSLRVGATLVKFTRDGYGENLNVPGLDQYDKDVFGFRGSIEWDASENLTFKLSGDYTEDESSPKSGYRLQEGAVSGAPILDNEYDTRAGLLVPEQQVDAKGLSLVGEWELSDAWAVKGILANRRDETWSPIDFDALPVDDLDVPVNYKNEQTSVELQLLYNNDRLSGVAGLYYLDANAYNNFDVVLGQVGPLIGVPGLNANTVGDVNTYTWSAFADFTYDVNDQWSVSLGGRYTSDTRTSQVLRQTYAGGISPIFGGTAVVIATTSDFNGDDTFTDFSPRLSASWHPTEDQHIYLSYSEGFKGGGFDPRGQTSAAPDLDGDGTVSDAEIFEFMQFSPEEVKSYELGWKVTAMDGRLFTGVSVFYGDYTDVQIPGSIGVDTTGDGIEDTFTGVTTNAGAASLPGVEFEGRFNATDQLSFGWAIGYLDAEYDTFIDASGDNVADQAVFQNTPQWTAGGTASYEIPLANSSISLIGSFAYRDKASQFEFPNDLLDQDAFTLWDASIVWEDDDGHWRAGIHGKNLTDERYKVAGYNFPALGLEGNVTAFYGPPRTVTGTVEYRF